MNSTLADIKQLFNVKAIAYDTNLSALAEGTFGVFPEDSDVSVSNGTTFDTLPDKFRIVSKLGGKYYYSFDTIEKAKMFNQIKKASISEQVNIWKGIVENCNCINGVTLTINIDEQSLLQRDGLTWTHRDFVVVASPQELLCLCSCDGKHPVYENNVITKLLYDKIIAINSPFYTADIEVPITGLTTYANQAALNTAVPSPVAGALAIVTGAGLKQYSGSAWVVVGTVAGLMTNVDAFIAVNKTLNTDDVTTNDFRKLTLVIKGQPSDAPIYRDLEVNYVFPRGVKLHPALTVNGEVGIQFTQTQALVYAIGEGADLRAEEWENMNNYTDLNYYSRLSDGIQATALVYQFENGKQYDTYTFEFTTDKVERNAGDKRLFGVLIGVDTSLGSVSDEISDMFIPTP